MKEEDKKQAEELEKKPDSTAAPAVAHPAPVAKTAPPQPAKVAPATAPPVRTAPNAAPPAPAKNAPVKNAPGKAPAAQPADSASTRQKGRFKSIVRRGVSERITEDAAAMPAHQEEPAADPNGGTRPRAKRRE
jgi:hypothetical protein